MINVQHTMKFCCEDISKIENYDKAIADKTQTWDCHHRLEYSFTMSELKKLDKYFNRPSTELIFLTRAEHYKWPHKGTLEAALKNKGKTPWNKGKTFGKKYAEKCIRAQKTCKKVNAFDLSGTFIKSFPSISNAAKELKLNLANVRSVVHGRKSSTCGYIFVLA